MALLLLLIIVLFFLLAWIANGFFVRSVWVRVGAGIATVVVVVFVVWLVIMMISVGQEMRQM